MLAVVSYKVLDAGFLGTHIRLLPLLPVGYDCSCSDL